MVQTVKFSQFASASLADSSNQLVGLGSGVNVRSPKTSSWNTAGRPSPGYNGLLGYNTDLQQYEFFNITSGIWTQLAASSGSGTVTNIATGTGLTGGPITTSGTISLAPITSITTLTGPLSAPTAIQGPGGLNLLGFSYIPSAVNYFTIQNNTTGNNIALIASGSDANIYMQLNGKGTGGVISFGAATNDLAPDGAIGELIEDIIPFASSVNITTNIATNIASISLDPGNYDLYANIGFSITVAATVLSAWISQTSATLPDASLFNTLTSSGGDLFGNTGLSAPSIPLLVPAGSPVTVYLSCTATFASGTVTACGGLYARRRF